MTAPAQPHTAADDQRLDAIWHQRCAILNKAWVQVRYQRRRQRFFDLADKLTKSITVVLGASLMGRFFVDWLPWLATAITSVGLLSWNRLKQGISSYSNNVQNGKFDKVKVSYATREGEDKSTTMQINQLDQAFTRREHIVLGVHTPDCFGAIDQRIINDLHRLISES